ncbi:MAG: DUF3429 domain-containing protein [Pseudomonadota bacterium]
MESEPKSLLQSPALRLSLVGCIPIVVLTLWLVSIPQDHVWRDDTVVLLKTYAALALSFLGGIRFGLAVATDGKDQRLALAATAIPVLVAWIAVVLGEPGSFAMLAVAFAAQGAWDSISAHRGAAPAWFGRMRVPLTGFVVATMVAAFLVTA